MTLTWHLRPLLLSTQVGLLSAPGKLSWQRSNRFCESVPLNALAVIDGRLPDCRFVTLPLRSRQHFVAVLVFRETTW